MTATVIIYRERKVGWVKEGVREVWGAEGGVDGTKISQNSLSISFPEILKRQNRKPLRSLYYLTYFLHVRPPVCMQEGETEDDERMRVGGEEWRDKKKRKREKERECDNTTKWDQEGILSCSRVPVTPPGNICFISLPRQHFFFPPLFKPHSENKVLSCYYW